MIPDYVHSDCKSNAEKNLFKRFKKELSDDYVVLHSLALAKHETKLCAEIDFVVLSKRGVLCIEVKGGRIEQHKGLWYFIDRFGETNSKHESPFTQASSAMFALRRAVENRFGKSSPQRRCILGYAVMFPDISFRIPSPEWDLNRLEDVQSISNDLGKIIEKQLDYSLSEITRVSGIKTCHLLTGSELEAMVNFIRSDFEFVPSISVAIENAHCELLRLTEEQYEVLDQLGGNPRVVIKGPAGTGKTLIAAEKARRAAREGRIVLFLCFNKLLSASVRKNLQGSTYNGGSIEVWTLHAYARKTIIDAGLGDNLPEEISGDTFRIAYPELFERAIIENTIEPPFDLIVVDEGQDLRFAPYIQIMDWLLKGNFSGGNWYWFEDNQQNLFNMVTASDDDLLAKYRPAYCNLKRNCRNTKQISMFNTLATGTEPLKCLVDGGVKVEPIFYKSSNHQLSELENVLKRLLGGGVAPRDIVILSPLSHERSIIGGVKTLAGVPLSQYEIDSSSTKNLRYSTIQGFKGLESKVVVVTDIEELASAASRCLDYVAFSRATSCLEVMINESARAQYLQLVTEFANAQVERVRS
jgi:hypothetical protein